MDGYLEKQYPSVISAAAGQLVNLPLLSLITGNINNDTRLDINDYSALIDCFGSKVSSSTCLFPPTSQSSGADILDDNGQVDGADYNELIREMSVQQGQ